MRAVELLEQQITDGLINGACVAIGGVNGVDELICRGFADVQQGLKMDENSIFDIASVTKVFGVTTLLLYCRKHDLLDYDAALENYLEEFAGQKVGTITIRQLATHLSGLNNSKPYNQYIGNMLAMHEAFFDVKQQAPDPKKYDYACINFILLGMVVERLLGKRLDRAASEIIFKPLSLKHSFWGSVPDALHPHLVRMPNVEPGIISDETARALFPEYILGNAGIFMSISDAACYSQVLLMAGVGIDNPAFIESNTFLDEIDAVFHRSSPQNEEGRALGWGYGNQAGFSDSVIYHSGWTGQSVWIDPIKQKFVIVFTNRIGDWALAKQARLDFAGAWLNEFKYIKD